MRQVRSWPEYAAERMSVHRPNRMSAGLVAAAGGRPEQAQRASALDRLGAPVYVELVVDVAHVRLDGARREVQLGGDLGADRLLGR